MPTHILEVAREVTTEQGLIWNPRLETIIRFCIANAEITGFLKVGKRIVDPTDNEKLRLYVRKYLLSYFKEYDGISKFKPVSTVADPAIAMILKAFEHLDDTEIASKYHRQSMAAENLLGSLLERYIAAVLEPHGWIWCAGNTVRSVDFLSPDLAALQVKNRSNSENSSSSAVRRGTTIKKWSRIVSKSGSSKWHEFPATDSELLSEAGFYAYIQDYALRR